MLWSSSICGLGSYFLPLFTGVRGIGILGSPDCTILHRLPSESCEEGL